MQKAKIPPTMATALLPGSKAAAVTVSVVSPGDVVLGVVRCVVVFFFVVV
jgi:hypothetical protein